MEEETYHDQTGLNRYYWVFRCILNSVSDRIDNFRVYMFGGAKFEYDLASNSTARKAEDLVKLEKISISELRPVSDLIFIFPFLFFLLKSNSATDFQ